ncbi:MAG: hypothetical protein EPO21_22190 [Chloroflexota bacterium]|nr:MAG: hypothetical protein EPO21_22190 [Chloroflexota bacterium]
MHGNRDVNDERRRELSLYEYVQAFDRGDFEAVAKVLTEAISDAELDRQIADVNAVLHADAGLQPVSEQSRLIRELMLRHLPSALVGSDEVPAPITIGDVAARLQAEHAIGQPLLPADLVVNRTLLASMELLPTPVTSATILSLATRLQVMASARYWELFRRAALMLAIARQRGEVQLAAARARSRPRRRSRREVRNE